MFKYIEYEAPWTQKDMLRLVLAIFIFPTPIAQRWDVALVLHLLTIEVKKKEKAAAINPALSPPHSSG